jgi:hypothetical protein
MLVVGIIVGVFIALAVVLSIYLDKRDKRNSGTFDEFYPDSDFRGHDVRKAEAEALSNSNRFRGNYM